jgi:chemotaxis protein CheD
MAGSSPFVNDGRSALGPLPLFGPGLWRREAQRALSFPGHAGSASFQGESLSGGSVKLAEEEGGRRRESPEVIRVGMAEGHVTGDPSSILAALGLGSCVAVMLYDPARRIAGMAHIMLPTSPDGVGGPTPYKFADTAIPRLVEEMVKAGAKPSRLVAKLAGGASMFQTAAESPLNIGQRNIQAVQEQLKRLNIRVVASRTGGNVGRSVFFYPATGMARVRSIGQEEQEF